MSLKASSSIAGRNIEKSVGASTLLCLTQFVIANVSETSPPFLAFTIIPVCRFSIIVVNFSGHPYFLSSCHSPVLPTVANAFVKLTKTIYRGQSCSMHFSWSCHRQKIMSTVLRFERNPHCVSGTTSWVMWLESLFSRIRAKILPAAERRDIPCSIITTFCSVSFFVDGDYVGILPGLWYMSFLPYADDPSMQSVG